MNRFCEFPQDEVNESEIGDPDHICVFSFDFCEFESVNERNEVWADEILVEPVSEADIDLV